MLCAVYKSPRKADTYLFILKRDDFSSVPEPLMKTFGTPQLVTLLNLAKRDRLGTAELNKVKQALDSDGFYLQLPPPPENLLEQHRKTKGLK